MRLQFTNRRPCGLERGQARRVSQNPRGVLVGYHICCPRWNDDPNTTHDDILRALDCAIEREMGAA